jgi:hypothetical protein
MSARQPAALPQLLHGCCYCWRLGLRVHCSHTVTPLHVAPAFNSQQSGMVQWSPHQKFTQMKACFGTHSF